eukprot:g4984.t1
MTLELSFDEYWPHWPENVQGALLVDVWYHCSFADFVNTLWSPDSSFLIDANKERNFTDFHSTDWLVSETELPDRPGGFSWTFERSKPEFVVGNLAGKIRKVRFENRKANGLLVIPFKSEEVQRCIVHENDKKCIVDACVNSTAPFCEKIRILCRHICEAQGEKKTHLTVVYHVVYLRSVNGFTKFTLDRGIRDGLKSNYNAFTQVLSRHVSVASDTGSVAESEISETTVAAVTGALSPKSDPVVSNVRYEPLINWQAMPPFSLLRSLFIFSGEAGGGLVTTFWKLISVVLHFYLLSFLFGFFTFAFETFLALTKESYIVPDLAFQEALFGAFLLMLTLEIAHLIVYLVFQLFSWLWKSVRFMTLWIWRSCRRVRSADQMMSRRISEVSNYEDVLDDQSTSMEELEPSCSHNEPQSPSAARSSFSNVSRTISSVLFPGTYEASKYNIEESLKSRTNADGSIIEEVFENERLQPFRGWGHTWPGHFLPTDKCAHWCAFDENGKFLTSNERKLIEPQLPPGWEWVQNDWTVDKEENGFDSVDSNGWYYGLDFPWMKYCREKNGGIRKISDFVRRRRHIRTRRRAVFEDVEIDENAINRTRRLEGIDFKTGRIEPPYFSFFNFL